MHAASKPVLNVRFGLASAQDPPVIVCGAGIAALSLGWSLADSC